MGLKEKFKVLAKDSNALNSLLPEERKAKIDEILTADPEQLQRFIQIFEAEIKQKKLIDKQFETSEAEKAEISMAKQKVDQQRRNDLEKEARTEDQRKADDLLKSII